MTHTHHSIPSRLPYFHGDLGFPAKALTPELREFQRLWHKAGDILKHLPPGTRARLEDGAGWLTMAPMMGELFLFKTTDLTGPFEHCMASGPFNPRHTNIWSHAPRMLKRDSEIIARWLANPVFDTPVDPELVTDVVCSTYRQDGPSDWEWNGNNPLLLIRQVA